MPQTISKSDTNHSIVRDVFLRRWMDILGLFPIPSFVFNIIRVAKVSFLTTDLGLRVFVSFSADSLECNREVKKNQAVCASLDFVTP
jgi:small basic protein